MSLEFKCPSCGKNIAIIVGGVIACRNTNCYWDSDCINDGFEYQKPKTKRFMTREEIMDFIFENRNKQMWLRYSNNGGWLMASSCIIGDGGIITYEYTFDKGKTIHNFEVEE
jgi:hypothetical protein